jgi:hypothetical protein
MVVDFANAFETKLAILFHQYTDIPRKSRGVVSARSYSPKKPWLWVKIGQLSELP